MPKNNRKYLLMVTLILVSLGVAWVPVWAQAPTTIVHLACPCHGNAFNDILRDLAQQFNESQDDVHVVVEAASGNYEDLVQVLIAAGTPPDVLHVQNQNAASMTGSLVNLATFLERDGIDVSSLLVPHAVQGLNVRGHQYSLPIFAQPRALGYRPDFFESAGLSSPSEMEEADAWNWTSYTEAARRLTLDRNGDGEIDQWGTTLSRSRADIQAWARSAGEELFDRMEEPSRVTFTRSRTVEAIQSYLDIKNVYNAASPESFRAGRTAMQIWLQPGHILNYQEVPFEWDIAEIPAGPVTRVAHTSFNGVQISAIDAAEQEAAWRWVKHLVFDIDSIRAFMAGTGRTPALIEALPDYLSLVDYPIGRTAFVPAMGYAKSDIMSTKVNEINRLWNTEFQGAWNGEEALESALTRIESMVNALIAE